MGDMECPVIQELQAIFEHTKTPFRIVIDDARLFGNNPAYPDIKRIENVVSQHRPDLVTKVENDAILIHEA